MIQSARPDPKPLPDAPASDRPSLAAWHAGWAVAAALLALLALGLPRRTCAVLMLLALAFSLGLLNQAPDSPYLDQSLQLWEQSRYSHFHGLSQWLGWLWPYLVMAYGVALASRREAHH